MRSAAYGRADTGLHFRRFATFAWRATRPLSRHRPLLARWLIPRRPAVPDAFPNPSEPPAGSTALTGRFAHRMRGSIDHSAPRRRSWASTKVRVTVDSDPAGVRHRRDVGWRPPGRQSPQAPRSNAPLPAQFARRALGQSPLPQDRSLSLRASIAAGPRGDRTSRPSLGEAEARAGDRLRHGAVFRRSQAYVPTRARVPMASRPDAVRHPTSPNRIGIVLLQLLRKHQRGRVWSGIEILIPAAIDAIF
jgi:hypothetical protein